MIRSFSLMGLTAALLVAAGLVFGDEKEAKKEKDPGAKAGVKDRLPPNFGKLKLNDEQRTKILSIRKEYRAQIQELEEKIEALKQKEKAEMEEVLTEEQVESLKKLEKKSPGKDKPEKVDKEKDK